MDPKTHIIPLDTAHRILRTFGFAKPTPACQRWVRPDGVRLVDSSSKPSASLGTWRMDIDRPLGEQIVPLPGSADPEFRVVHRILRSGSSAHSSWPAAGPYLSYLRRMASPACSK